MKISSILQLLVILMFLIQSCKKQNVDQVNNPNNPPPAKPTLSITSIESKLPNENKRSCTVPNAPASGDKHLLFINYSSNTHITKYNVLLRMIITADNPSVKADTLLAQVDSVNSQTVFHNLCQYMNCGIKYSVVNCSLLLKDKINDTVVATSNADTIHINNPRTCFTTNDFELQRADVRAKSINNCITSAGTGSTYDVDIYYLKHVPISLDDFYVEVKVDYNFSKSGSGSFIAFPYEVDDALGIIRLSLCYTFGEDDNTSVTEHFTAKLYEKDENGNKIGNGFLISNTIGPYTDSRPLGASRHSKPAIH